MTPTIGDIRAGKYLVLASCSGGKDSAAMSLWFREQGIGHLRIYADTGWESPILYEYLRGPLTAKLGPIIEVGLTGGMEGLIRKKAMFPSRTRKFCTTELKVKPIQAVIRGLQDEGHEVINAVGIRREESAKRADWPEWEWQDDFDCWKWAPLVEWKFQDVVDIHARHSLMPCPLYLMGAQRVGCWPCIHARKAEISMIARVDPGRIDQIDALEREIEGTAAERYAERGESFESLGYMRPTFFGNPTSSKTPDGRHSGRPMPIRDVVAWANTSRGGSVDQIELFAPGPSQEGCMRWGLCDIAGEGEEV